ncbi:hypothetical protein FQW77_08500 [Campylobacter jejuni]|nr:hypothetical protein [Campylobacter jejuni]
MLNLTINKVAFDELNINNLSKRGVFHSIMKFWNGTAEEYFDYLNNIGINYYQTFSNIYEFNKNMNEDIEKLKNAIKNNNIGSFDFKIVNLLAKNLKEMNDNEYYKLNIDLRGVNDRSQLEQIKEILLKVPSPSLVDFKEMSDERFSLIYHKKGSLKYFDQFLLHQCKADKIQLLENFKEPKDNNFIVARFLLLVSASMLNENINESFCYSYNLGQTKKEVIKDVQEIFHWGNLNPEQKEIEKRKEKEEEEINEIAINQAKDEIKNEINKNRNSLNKDSMEEVLQKEKVIPKIHNVNSLNNEEKEIEKIKQLEKNNNSEEEEIEKIIKNSCEIYLQKEMEKTRIKLAKAQEESYNAYKDLKNYLNEGTSILEGIKIIQQKYRNEDTINLATLLFSKDILTLKEKEKQIINLKEQIQKSVDYENELMDEITKRDETISKLKGTLQSKVNEITAMEAEFEKEMEQLKISDEKLKETENLLNEQEVTIRELDEENNHLSIENKELNEELIKLKSEREFLIKQVQESKNLQEENNNLRINIEREKIQNEYLSKSITEYKNNEIEYKNKIEELTNRLIRNSEAKTEQKETSQEHKRVIDILGKA